MEYRKNAIAKPFSALKNSTRRCSKKRKKFKTRAAFNRLLINVEEMLTNLRKTRFFYWFVFTFLMISSTTERKPLSRSISSLTDLIA